MKTDTNYILQHLFLTFPLPLSHSIPASFPPHTPSLFPYLPYPFSHPLCLSLPPLPLPPSLSLLPLFSSPSLTLSLTLSPSFPCSPMSPLLYLILPSPHLNLNPFPICYLQKHVCVLGVKTVHVFLEPKMCALFQSQEHAYVLSSKNVHIFLNLKFFQVGSLCA